jgi:regulator of replication initiation timing
MNNADPIPAGKYVAAITASETKLTPITHEPYLRLEFTIVEGDYKGHKVFDRLYINHHGDRVENIARGRLSAICRAVGVMQLRNTKELHNLELIINVKLKKRSDNGEPTNEINGFEAKLDDDADAEDSTKENAQLKFENAQLKFENAQLKFENAQLKFENAQLQLENERLRAIVDKLPKTADGMAVFIDDKVYHPDYDVPGQVDYADSIWMAHFNPDCKGSEWAGVAIRNCYSTREAAEAAEVDAARSLQRDRDTDK